MITIYKELPKTNCRECGVPTCMALALKVSKGQAEISECPHVDPAVFGAGPDPNRKSCSTYEEVSASHERQAAETVFRETAEIVGGMYRAGPQGETITLNVLNRTYALRKSGLYDDSGNSPDPWMKIIVCDYIRRRGQSGPSGQWVALSHFPRTASHVKAFQAAAEKKIAARFGASPEELEKSSAALGAVSAQGPMKADLHLLFDLLPHVPLLLAFWRADEEFGAEAKLFVDANAGDHIDIEYLGHLIERFTEDLAGE